MGSIKRDISGTIINSLQKRGFWETICLIPKNGKYLLEQILDRGFDLKWGTNTSGIDDEVVLRVHSKSATHAFGYQAVTPKEFRKILAVSCPAVDPNTTFVDMGSGKGRVLMMMANQYPSQPIVGVEFSPELHDIARNNIEIFCRKLGHRVDIKLYCMDAADYEFPDTNVVLFLFNPFGEVVMAQVLSKLKCWYQKFGNKLTIIYFDPTYKKLFDQQQFLIPKVLHDDICVYLGK